MDKLRDMAAFVGVVDAKTFTAAADRMDVSKSVLSRRLAALEERLGVRLLNRTTRRLGLTEAGRAYYDRCVRILAEIDDSEQAVSSLNAEPRGVIRLNAPVSFGMLHLAPAIAAFMDQYPQVDFDLVLNDRFVDLIDEGYDMAVRIGTLADSSLIARKLAVSRRVVCASPAYLARRPAPLHPRDLADHACILYRNPALYDQWAFRTPEGQVETVQVSGRIRVNNGDMMRDIAVAGQGLVLLPSFLVADRLVDGRLVALMCDYRVDATRSTPSIPITAISAPRSGLLSISWPNGSAQVPIGTRRWTLRPPPTDGERLRRRHRLPRTAHSPLLLQPITPDP